MLIVFGLIVLALGVIVSVGERLPIRFGRLPGDIMVEHENYRFYFPIITSLVISVVLSILIWLLRR